MPYKDKNKKRLYQSERSRKLRQQWLDINGPCACGSNIDLQVDHVDPSSKVSHRIWSWSEERRKIELVKCQALCLKCHKKKSAAEAKKGEECPQTKLSEQDVLAIRAEYKPGVRGSGGRLLAKKYGVSRYTIWSLINNQAWKHIKGPLVQQ